MPYDDPHLAWLVRTYLHTPEGQQVLHERTGQASPSQPAAASPSPATRTHRGFETVGTCRGDLLTAPLPEPVRLTWQPVALGAALSLLLLGGGGAAFLLQQEPADATPTAAPLPQVERTYEFSVTCAFMKRPVTVRIQAFNAADARSAVRSRLAHCEIDAPQPTR